MLIKTWRISFVCGCMAWSQSITIYLEQDYINMKEKKKWKFSEWSMSSREAMDLTSNKIQDTNCYEKHPLLCKICTDLIGLQMNFHIIYQSNRRFFHFRIIWRGARVNYSRMYWIENKIDRDNQWSYLLIYIN